MAILNKFQPKGSQFSRGLRIGCLIGLFAAVVIGAISVPFVYESQTLWYKIGTDKTMLRLGKIAGLLAVVLLFVQVLLGLRGEFLEKLLGVSNLMMWHRVNGRTVLLLVLVHVLLVLLPEGISNLPIGVKFWPEMIGGVLSLVLLTMVISSSFRELLGLVYTRWRIIHKLLGYSALILVPIHIIFVSESFDHVLPRTALIAIEAGIGMVILRVKIDAFLKQRQNQ